MFPLLFLGAYACSGLAGLIYEVSWTRLLTLEMGRGIAASSTVLAAFMGGLALGAALAGRTASTMTPKQALQAYAGLELAVAVLAIALPFELRALSPVFASAYQNGSADVAFGLVRFGASLLLLLLPAMALGATFPLAVRWFGSGAGRASRRAGQLYAANTIGAALGALLSGFVLVPAVGVMGTLLVGVGTSLVAMSVAVALSLRAEETPIVDSEVRLPPVPEPRTRKSSQKGRPGTGQDPAPR